MQSEGIPPNQSRFQTMMCFPSFARGCSWTVSDQRGTCIVTAPQPLHIRSTGTQGEQAREPDKMGLGPTSFQEQPSRVQGLGWEGPLAWRSAAMLFLGAEGQGSLGGLDIRDGRGGSLALGDIIPVGHGDGELQGWG